MKINPEELAFVAKIPLKNARSIFQIVLENPKITLADQADVKDLAAHFPKVRSHDPRYHGESILTLAIRLVHNDYRKQLADPKVQAAGKWIGGRTIFNKVLNKTEKRHVKERFASY